MERNGKQLSIIPDGHPRRMADGKNAVRKMTSQQHVQFIEWMREELSPETFRLYVVAAEQKAMIEAVKGGART